MGRHEPPPTPKYSDKGPCCSGSLRFCCYSFFVILLAIIILLTIVIMKYKPSLPTIDITEFETVKFEVGPELILQTKFVLSMKVDNSKTSFRLTLEKGSCMEMSYNNSAISTGTVPEFRQEPGTVLDLKVVMEGKNKFKGDLKVVKAKCKKSSSVPLLLLVELPMVVESKGYGTAQVKFNIACALVVDHLDVEQQPNRITSHTCSFPNLDVDVL